MTMKMHCLNFDMYIWYVWYDACNMIYFHVPRHSSCYWALRHPSRCVEGRPYQWKCIQNSKKPLQQATMWVIGTGDTTDTGSVVWLRTKTLCWNERPWDWDWKVLNVFYNMPVQSRGRTAFFPIKCVVLFWKGRVEELSGMVLIICNNHFL